MSWYDVGWCSILNRMFSPSCAVTPHIMKLHGKQTWRDSGNEAFNGAVHTLFPLIFLHCARLELIKVLIYSSILENYTFLSYLWWSIMRYTEKKIVLHLFAFKTHKLWFLTWPCQRWQKTFFFSVITPNDSRPVVACMYFR